MAKDYSQRIPVDRDGNKMTGLATPYPAIATTVRENASASSVTALNANTTLIEVAAVGVGAAIRWSMQNNLSATSSVIVAAGTAAYDNIIPAGTIRQFVVPRFSAGIPNYNANQNPSIAGLNTSEGLYNGIAMKNMGVGSVLLTEY